MESALVIGIVVVVFAGAIFAGIVWDGYKSERTDSGKVTVWQHEDTGRLVERTRSPGKRWRSIPVVDIFELRKEIEKGGDTFIVRPKEEE